MPTREQAKKAWEYGRQSQKHYEGLTEEQKTAMWLYARDNGLISKENLSNVATPEYGKYVKTPWVQYAAKPSNDIADLKVDKYAGYKGVKVPVEENKTVVAPKPKLTLAQSQQQKLKRQQIAEIMTADKQPLKPTLNKPVSKYDAERKTLGINTTPITPGKSKYDTERQQLKGTQRDWNAINSSVSKPVQTNNSGRDWNSINKAAGGLFNQPAQEVKPSSGGLFNQTPQKTNPSSGGLFKNTATNSAKQLYDYVSQDKQRFLQLNDEGKKTYLQYGLNNNLLKPENLTQESLNIAGWKPKEESLKDKAINFFANIGKKAVDTYDSTANKDRIGLLGSDKIFSVKDAQNYTNGPKGENPIFNAMAKPSRTALYTLLAPMRSKIFNRGISQADNTMTMNENTSKKIDSGSKIGNAIADIGGTVLGYAVNPAGVDGSLLNLSQGLSKPIAKTISKKVLSKTTSKVANKILPALGREFVEGSSLSVANDLVNKKDTKTIIKNAAIQGGIGAVLGGSIEGLGLLKNSAFKTATSESKLGLKSPKGKVFQNAENVKLKDYYNNLEGMDYSNSLDPAYIKAENALRAEKGLPPLNKLNAKLTLKKERVLSPVLETGQAPKQVIKPMFNNTVVGSTEWVTPKLEPTLQPKTAAVITPKIEPILKPKLQITPKALNELPINAPSGTIPDTLGTIASKLDKKPINNHIMAKGYTEVIDNLDPINRVSPTAYEKALNTRQNDMIAHRILTNKLVDTKGNVIGDSLKDITKDMPIAQKNEFADYLKARHAPSWIDQGRKVYPDNLGITSEMAKQKALNYEILHPEFKAQADKLVKFQQDLTKSWLVDTGIMKQSSWEELIKKYPDYVPFMREFTDLEKGGVYAKRGFVNQSNPVKQGVGSQSNTIDSVETIAERIGQYVKTAKRNEVGKELVKTIQGNPSSFSGIAEIVTPKNAELNSNALADINKILETDGIDGIVTKLNNSYDDMFSARKGGAIERGNNIVTVLDNGSPVYLKINDPDLLKAVSSLDQTTIPKIFQAIGKGTNVMKTLTTGINPAFGLARNVWKDLVTGYVNSKTINANPLGYAKYIWDMTKAVGNVIGEGTDKAIGSKLPDSLETLLKKASDPLSSFKNIGGGGHASNITADRNLFNDSIKSLYKQKPSLKNIPKKLYEGLEGLNNVLELSPRLAEYKRQIKAGNSIDKALFESQDLTVNFSRHGDTAKLIDSFVPYYNSAWQGLDKTIRQFNPANGNGKQVLNSAAKAIYAITIPTIVLYAKNHNDPAYQMLSDYQKDNFFNIPKGDGTFIKIPKPRELGVIFGAVPERLLKTFKDNDPNGFKRFAENAWQNFAPPDPITENIAMPAFKTLNTPEGRDWRNNPIVSQGQLPLSPKLQYDESTSEFGKAVGNVVNVSPKKIDNLAKSYLGGVAQFGLPALTKGKSVGNMIKSQFTVDPLYSNDILNDFYTRYDKAKTAAADNNKVNSIPSKLLTKQERIVSQYRKTSDTISRLQDMIKLEKDQDKIKELRRLILQKAKESNF